MKEKKDEKEDIVAVIEITIGEEKFIVPIDNWNAAVKEGRTEAVILGNELHFMTVEDYERIKLVLQSTKNDDYII